MRFIYGFVPSWRYTLNPDKKVNPFYGDGYLELVWLKIKQSANYEQTGAIYKPTGQPLKPGQTILGYREIAAMTGFNESVVKTRLKKLVKLRLITVETGRQADSHFNPQRNSHSTLITVRDLNEISVSKMRADSHFDSQNDSSVIKSTNKEDTAAPLGDPSKPARKKPKTGIDAIPTLTKRPKLKAL